MSDDILDLDILVPPSKTIKVGEKTFTVKPATIRQLAEIAKLERELNNNKTDETAAVEYYNLLEVMIPGIKEVELTPLQLFNILQFVRDMGIPENIPEVEKQFSPKKKVALPNQLPTSSISTQDTPLK